MKTWQHDETGRMTDAPECPGPRWAEVPNYTPPLDDEGRLMVGAHHYTAESIRARIEQLRRYASGSAESAVEFINLDWRGFCNTTAHIMSALYAGLEPTPEDNSGFRDLCAAAVSMDGVPISTLEALEGPFPAYADAKAKQDWYARAEATYRYHRADAMLRARR